MNKIYVLILFILLFLFCCFTTPGDEIIHDQPPFLPYCVDVMGMGEAFTANSQGYSSLFYNPAGFAMGDYSLTLIAASPWLYTDPFTLVRLPGMSEHTKEEVITREILSGGYGNGIHAGIGFVKNGIGIGTSFIMDSYLSGDENTQDMSGNVHMTLGFILGYAYTLTFSDIIISIGGDIRPMARVYVPVTGAFATEMAASFARQGTGLLGILADAQALYGFGIGIDAGMIVQTGPLKFGLSVRDIGGTFFDYRESSVHEVMGSLAVSGMFPGSGEKPEGVYRIPMNVSAGISYHPDLGGFTSIIDPRIHLDFKNILQNVWEEKDLLSVPHLGIETVVLNTLTIRGGYAKGLISAGMGMNIFFLDFDLACFFQEYDGVTVNNSTGSSVIELALRLKI